MVNKVQKNENGVNVIVELEDSSGRHYYHENKRFKNPKLLSDEEIVRIAEANMTLEDRLEVAKTVVSKLDGYGVSNTSNNTIKHGDIVEYELDEN